MDRLIASNPLKGKEPFLKISADGERMSVATTEEPRSGDKRTTWSSDPGKSCPPG